MLVEIDVYSGRPNPKLNLGEAASRELAAKLRDLPKSTAAVPDPGLGYRGFVLTLEPSAAGVRRTCRVFAGVVAVEDNGRTELFTDARGAEALLKSQAASAGFADLVR